MSTNQYKSENDYYAEYINDNIYETTNNNDIITKTELVKDFKIWYKDFYENIKALKKPEIEKQLISSLKKKFTNLEFGKTNKFYFN